MRDEVVMARQGLLDALVALEDHLDALVIVGAQAVYIHTGAADVALAEYTTDGDLAIDPDLLSSEPLVQKAMSDAGFSEDPRSGAIGSWVSPAGVLVDLMVPESVAGGVRRSVDVPPHDPKSMRKTRGLEAALVDKSRQVISATDSEADQRQLNAWVAGPAALLVSKLHKIGDRVKENRSIKNKDAHDVYRLLRAVTTQDFADGLRRLQNEEISAQVTTEAIEYLDQLFASGSDARGSVMAGNAEAIVGNPTAVSESVALLASDLLVAPES